MKKILFTITFLAIAFIGFSQGRYLTRHIENAVIELRQPVFGAAAFTDSTKTQALTADTWSVISSFASLGSNDVTVSDDTMTISKNGGYAIDAGLSFYATASDTIEVQVYKNGTAIVPKFVSTGGATITSATFSTYASLSQGDKVTLRMRNIASNDDAVLKSGSLFLRRIYTTHDR